MKLSPFTSYFSNQNSLKAPIQLYRFYKFRLDASKELFEQLQSHDNIPQKFLPFIFITTTSNGTQVHIILPTMMPSMRVKSLNWTKAKGKKKKWGPVDESIRNFFKTCLGYFVKIAWLQWKGLKINLLKLNLVSNFYFF